MARFVGNFEHTLDEKGRLILPSAFRPKLAEGAFITRSTIAWRSFRPRSSTGWRIVWSRRLLPAAST